MYEFACVSYTFNLHIRINVEKVIYAENKKNSIQISNRVKYTFTIFIFSDSSEMERNCVFVWFLFLANFFLNWSKLLSSHFFPFRLFYKWYIKYANQVNIFFFSRNGIIFIVCIDLEAHWNHFISVKLC